MVSNIDFLRYRAISFIFSTVVIAAGIVSYVMHGGFRYSVDFTGGSQVLFRFEQPVKGSDIKKAMEDAHFESVSIREFSDREILVRVQEFSRDPRGLAGKMEETFQKSFAGNKCTILETNAVGPAVGRAFRTVALYAILISLFAILVYIGLRTLSLGYALGAVVAIFHDALVVLAIFSLFNLEISINVIGAILAVLGYSINDTIVIFSRIREEFGRGRHSSPAEVVNKSINYTLRRTLLTSLSTCIAVATLLFVGGEALRNLSLALLVGIVFGTYSSIYIASPVMLLLRRLSKA